MAMKNLPIISVRIADEGLPQPEIFTKPAAVAFGWVEGDFFGADRRPLFFNTPYYIPSMEEANSLLPGGGPGLDYASMIASGANKANPNDSSVPVIVRVGYPDYKVSIDSNFGTGESTDAAGSLTINSGTNDIAKVEWSDHVWDANASVSVVKNANGTVSIFYNYDNSTGAGFAEENAQNLDVSSDVTVKLSALGVDLTLFSAGVSAASAGEIAKFHFQARRKPANKSELYKAVIDGMKGAEGLQASFATIAEAHLDDKIDDVAIAVAAGDPDDTGDLVTNPPKLNFGYALARFCYSVSSSYHMCIGVMGVNKPEAYGPTNLANWIDSLANLDGWKDGFYATSSGRLGDSPIVDETGAPVDIGKYLVVVAMHGKVTGYNMEDIGPYVAAWLANRPVAPATSFVNIEFTPNQLGIESYDSYLALFTSYNLVDKAYGARINFPVAVFDEEGSLAAFKIPIARTAAMASSSFTKLSTAKIAVDLMKALRAKAENYLGKPLSGLTLEVMRSDLQNVINSYVQAGYFANGTVAVEPGAIGSVLGEVKVTARIAMYAEITTISITGIFKIAGV